MPLDVYLGMIAAANMKQRTRKQIEYYHGDRLNYAVAGTPNRLEYDQGFFVKNGDGAADFKPIAHLYKTQVYQLAEALGVPEEIRRRPPTTDTWSLPQGQDEYYFSLPYDRMDICLFGLDHGVSPDAVADAAGLTPEQVDAVSRPSGKWPSICTPHRRPCFDGAASGQSNRSPINRVQFSPARPLISACPDLMGCRRLSSFEWATKKARP